MTIKQINEKLHLTARYGMDYVGVDRVEVYVINFMIIGLIWKECFHGQYTELSETLKLGYKLLQNLRNGYDENKTGYRVSNEQFSSLEKTTGVPAEALRGDTGFLFRPGKEKLLVQYRRLVYMTKKCKDTNKYYNNEELIARLYNEDKEERLLAGLTAMRKTADESKQEDQQNIRYVDKEIDRLRNEIVNILKEDYNAGDLIDRATKKEPYALLLYFIKYRGASVKDADILENLIKSIRLWDDTRLEKLDDNILNNYKKELQNQVTFIDVVNIKRERNKK